MFPRPKIHTSGRFLPLLPLLLFVLLFLLLFFCLPRCSVLLLVLACFLACLHFCFCCFAAAAALCCCCYCYRLIVFCTAHLLFFPGIFFFPTRVCFITPTLFLPIDFFTCICILFVGMPTFYVFFFYMSCRCPRRVRKTLLLLIHFFLFVYPFAT